MASRTTGGKRRSPTARTSRNPDRPLFRVQRNARYLAFFKPYGVLCQFSQPEDSDKSTLKEFGFPAGVYPVGRLDYDSEGLLILSDDPRLNKALLDPAHGHARAYLVQVENVPAEQQLAQLRTGVIVGGERCRPAEAELLEAEPRLPARPVPIRERKSIPTAWIRLTLREGKNRQVRRMTAAVGCPTLRLVRESIGSLNLAGLRLEPGNWVPLSEIQVQQLFERKTGLPGATKG